MILEVRLDVRLKGADLVASTAYLTLVNKMGYEGRVLGVEHGKRFEFTIECADASQTAQTIRTLFANQSYFYNINKHSFYLDCRWQGGSLTDGTPIDEASVTGGAAGAGGSAYLTEVLIEDLDESERDVLGKRVREELGAEAARATVLGTVWYLTLKADTPEAARELTDEIVVTTKRDRGLLLNPNGQLHHIISTEVVKS